MAAHYVPDLNKLSYCWVLKVLISLMFIFIHVTSFDQLIFSIFLFRLYHLIELLFRLSFQTKARMIFSERRCSGILILLFFQFFRCFPIDKFSLFLSVIPHVLIDFEFFHEERNIHVSVVHSTLEFLKPSFFKAYSKYVNSVIRLHYWFFSPVNLFYQWLKNLFFRYFSDRFLELQWFFSNVISLMMFMGHLIIFSILNFMTLV